MRRPTDRAKYKAFLPHLNLSIDHSFIQLASNKHNRQEAFTNPTKKYRDSVEVLWHFLQNRVKYKSARIPILSQKL
jgi:hypothetical protein